MKNQYFKTWPGKVTRRFGRTACFRRAVIAGFAAVSLFYGAIVSAQDTPEPDAKTSAQQEAPKPRQRKIFGWNLLFSGSWEESASAVLEGTLNNRAEIKLNIVPANLLLRAQVLDRRQLRINPINFNWNEFMGDPQKWITNFTGGAYHRTTGSRLLFGVIDEFGLPARIRNPWIRSVPFAENRNSSGAELKTSASAAKEDELYLYLSSPRLDISRNFGLEGFISVQTEIDEFTPALTGGINFLLDKNINLSADIFFTEKTLPQKKSNTWFSDPPPLPERDFRLTAAGILYKNPAFSISSDFALSTVFAWGTDIYANFGITLTPLLQFEKIAALTGRARPLSISLAAEGAGMRFVSRDGVNRSENFRSALKIEWRNKYNSLFRFNIVLHGHSFGGSLYGSSTGVYYRFPSSARFNSSFFRFTVISFSADRDAENPLKTADTYKGSIGLRLNPWKTQAGKPFGFNFSGSVKGMTSSDGTYFLFPVPNNSWRMDSASIGCEFTWSPNIFQFRIKTEYINFQDKDDKWEISAGFSARFKYGRISLSAASPDFPKKWTWTLSWRLEIR